ncbi:nucleoporin NUP42-like isoform X2 [Physella acuta]|uniref:nucleoporin NUP42-like isoform X2 n=1 Tax=Physella acuta TaxID=109671 RepID=UPI0027DB0B52|nr:nucleoporin NUP42-like isoform X2 [Physella acuta]
MCQIVSTPSQLFCWLFFDLYDISFEELRTDAYHAIKNGNIQSYVEKIKKLEDEFAGKRRHLKHMTMETKQKLITFLDDVRRGITHKISDPVQTIFGQSRITDSNSSGQLGGTNNSTGVFGASVFGSTNSGPGTFGTSAGTFGTSAGTFGTSAGTFGRTSQPAVSTPSTNTSLFGGSDPSNSSFNSFASSNSLPSYFSKQITGVSSGSPTHQVHDNSQSNIFGGNQSGLFGNERNSSSNNPIGSFSNSQVSSPSSWLGKPQPGVPSINLPSDLFGKSAQSTPVFGSASTNQASVFNTSISQVQASQATNLFGKPSTQNVFNNPIPSMGKQNYQASISSNTSSNTSKLFTPLTDLTDLEKEAFNAKAFQIGKIPLRPPPQELLNL